MIIQIKRLIEDPTLPSAYIKIKATGMNKSSLGFRIDLGDDTQNAAIRAAGFEPETNDTLWLSYGQMIDLLHKIEQ